MSWYSVVYTWARGYRERHAFLGALVHCSFYVTVLMQLSMLCYSSYVYVWIVCFKLLTSNIQVSFYIAIWAHLTFMYLWCFMRTIFASTARVPANYEVDPDTAAKLQAVTVFQKNRPKFDLCTKEQLQQQNKLLEAFCQSHGILLAEVEKNDRIRYCYECRALKPDRCHHCSSCGFCVVRFDHHCPYINSCVAFHNYKFFVLMMLYLWFFCAFCALTSIEAIVRFFLLEDYKSHVPWAAHVITVVLIEFTFLYNPLGNLLRFHWQLISANETTCEQAKEPLFRGDPKAKYDVGRLRNLEIVFGWGLWFLPVMTPVTDGVHHEIVYESSADSKFRLTVAELSTSVSEETEESARKKKEKEKDASDRASKSKVTSVHSREKSIAVSGSAKTRTRRSSRPPSQAQTRIAT